MTAAGSSPGVSAQPPEDWQPGDPLFADAPERGLCLNAGCGATWTPAGPTVCPECGGLAASVSAQPRTPPAAAENANDGEEGRSGELRAIVHGAACACGEEVDACRSRLRSREVDAVADALLAAGFRRVAEDPAQVLEKLASDLEDRAWERDRDDGEADAGPQCDGECGNADCHRISAVATWQRAAVMVRDCGAALRGGEQQ